MKINKEDNYDYSGDEFEVSLKKKYRGLIIAKDANNNLNYYYNENNDYYKIKIDSAKNIKYYKNNKLHNDFGPAVIRGDNTEYYYEGKLHNTNGPAIDLTNGTKEFYLFGINYNKYTFYKKLKYVQVKN